MRSLDDFLRTRFGQGGIAVYFLAAIAIPAAYSLYLLGEVMPFAPPSGGRLRVKFSTPHHSILGLARCSVGGNPSLSFETAQSPDRWSFSCEKEDDFASTIGVRSTEVLVQRVKITGWLNVPLSASPGLFDGQLRGSIAVPVLISDNIKAGFEVRELPVEWPIQLRVLSQSDFDGYQRNRILLIAPALLVAAVLFYRAWRYGLSLEVTGS